MPEGYQKERPYPGKTFKLSQAAASNLLVLVRCSQCRRMVRYLTRRFLIELYRR